MENRTFPKGVKILLGHCNVQTEKRPESHVVEYDLSSFMQAFYGFNQEFSNKLSQFTDGLDDKVRIVADSEETCDIIRRIDAIVEKIQSKDKELRHLQRRHVGSLYNGTRVGLPYEADILLIDECNHVHKNHFSTEA